jgi:undecaprenyl-diphosphatase
MTGKLENRKIAILMTDGFEEEEFTKPQEALQQAGAITEVIADKTGKVKAWNHTNWGGEYKVDKTLNEVNSEDYNGLLLPGGVLNPDTLRQDDLKKVIRLRSDPEGRKIALLVLVGTVPALIGLPLRDQIEGLQEDVTKVGVAVIATGVILVIGQAFARGTRQLIEGRIPDAIVVGVAQAFALIPGISRSGTTISAGNTQGFEPTQAARFSFLLGIPAIAGAGLLSLPDLFESGTFGLELVVAMVVAAVSGYLAIAFLLAMLRHVGLIPFAIYCFVVGGLTVAFL